MEVVWREMEKLVKENLVRDIGFCYFTLKKLNKLLGFAEIMPSVCQVDYILLATYYIKEKLIRTIIFVVILGSDGNASRMEK